MSNHEEANSSNSNDGNNKPSSPVNHHKNSGTFNNDNTDSVDSASGLRHRIFAGNLDFGTTKEQLYDAFSKCGKIVDEIRLHPGYAFIQFESEQACSKAIATLSGTQLCSKRIDVQMAKGPNNSQKKDNKRKLDSRDRQPPSRNSSSSYNNSGDSKNDRFSRDRDNKNKKVKRTPPQNSQPPLPMPSSTMMPTSSPYSANSSGVTSVPIYIPDQTLEPFANFVMQTLKSGGLIYHNVHIRNTNQGELFFTSPQFLQLVANERFVIYIVARHEIARNIVSFKALMPDGTSPGFADTMITDICSFILNAPPPVQVSSVYQQYAMQYSVPPTTTPPSLNIPGLSFGYTPPPQQQTSQNYNNNRPSNQGGNYGNRDNRPSYNNNNRNNNTRNNSNNNRNDRRDDDRRGNNNRSNNNNNYRGGNNNNNSSYQKDSGANSSDNNEVQGLIIKLLDTINKKPTSSNSSILLSESANSTTGHNDDYNSPSDHHHY